MRKFDNKRFKNSIIGIEWEITNVDENFVGIKNESESYNIENGELLKFLFKNKISLINNCFNYECVIDNYDKFSSVKEFNTFNKIQEKHQNSKINYDDLKVGYVYQLETLNDYVVYLGKKWSISHKFNKKTGLIELTKPKCEHICYTVYEHDNFKIHGDISYYYKFILRKEIVIKEVQELKSKYSIEQILGNFKVSLNYLYFSDEKPKTEFDLVLTEVSFDYLVELHNKYNLTKIDLFHKSSTYYIKNHYWIYDKCFSTKEDTFSRHISKSDCDEVIFSAPFENTMKKYNEPKSYYSYDTKLAGLTDPHDTNDYYRIAPKNYHILELRPI